MKFEENNYYVKRMRMYTFLINKGFEPTATIPDPNNYKFRWWVFDNTVELQEAIKEYFDNCTGKKVK